MEKEQLKFRVSEIEEVLQRFLPPVKGNQKTVLEAMHYAVMAGGKRLRPMLLMETYRLFGGDRRELVEPFMAAIEMIHTYSLVHDDLPALDNDDYRRGRRTTHVVYGEDMAILAGDALLNYAYETAATTLTMDATGCAARAMQVLTRKPGIYGMIGGQTLDVEMTGQSMTMEQLLYIHENKTAALIECAMMIGAILAGAKDSEIKAMEQLAGKVGIAFQIQDDILDITSTAEELGKPVHSDERNAKVTYVTLRGLEQSRQDVEQLSQEAIGILEQLPYENPFLKELIIELITRTK
ncbi:MAG: polyprenyl synthetase family protein [Lachnospiraceae bacterium]